MNTSDSMGGLIKLGGNLEQPRQAKASDFPAVGPMGPAGQAEGAGKLVTQTEAQEGPRHTNDDGGNSASTWGTEDKGFVVQKNKGEGSGGGAVKCDWSVDFESGQIQPDIVKYPA